MWSYYWQKLMGAEVWRAERYANSRAAITMQPLTDIEGNEANTATEREKMLRRESFPANENDQCNQQPSALKAHTPITEQASERALHDTSFPKALGPDKLSFSAIWLLWKGGKEMVVRLTRAAILTGRHPAGWYRASAELISKTGKDYYTKVKPYRSISVHSLMGKVVQKVVADLLSKQTD